MYVTDVNMHITNVNMHVTDVNMQITDVNIHVSDVTDVNMHVSDVNMHVTDVNVNMHVTDVNIQQMDVTYMSAHVHAYPCAVRHKFRILMNTAAKTVDLAPPRHPTTPTNSKLGVLHHKRLGHGRQLTLDVKSQPPPTLTTTLYRMCSRQGEAGRKSKSPFR